MSTTAACLVASLVVTCGFLVAGTFNSRHGADTFSSILGAAISAYIIAFVVIVFLAIPFRYCAKRWQFARGWMVVTIGTVLGLLVVASLQYALTHIPILAGGRHPPFDILYIEFGLIGAAGGGAFWACCHREMRPNTSLERTREG
jgi:amino acid transporter